MKSLRIGILPLTDICTRLKILTRLPGVFNQKSVFNFSAIALNALPLWLIAFFCSLVI